MKKILAALLLLATPAVAQISHGGPSGGPIRATSVPTTINVNGTPCVLGASCTPSGPAASLTVGTTTISNGTNGYVEYNNAGVLGEVNKTTTSTANALVQRDASGNAFANSFSQGGQTIVTSSTPITLTVASSPNLVLTGSTAQTVNMPDATTLVGNQSSSYVINNNSSSTVTIQDASGGTLYSAVAGSYVRLNLLTNGSTAGTWDVHPSAPSIATWGSGTSGLQMNNALNTTPQISSGASSSTSPAFIPQRASSTTGFSGDSTHVYGIVGGSTVFTSTASTFSIPSGAAYQINGSQIATTNLSDVSGPTSWTPTDASGDGLTLTVNDAKYTKVGKIVNFWYNITYPSNAGTNLAKIGGLPYNTVNASNIGGCILIYNTAGASVADRLYFPGNNSTFFLSQGVTQSSPTNAQLTGANIRGSCTYSTN